MMSQYANQAGTATGGDDTSAGTTGANNNDDVVDVDYSEK